MTLEPQSKRQIWLLWGINYSKSNLRCDKKSSNVGRCDTTTTTTINIVELTLCNRSYSNIIELCLILPILFVY